MDIFGFLSAIFMGAVLGLIGGGGSILTAPILVYMFHIPPIMATGYSLLIVGSTACVGAMLYLKRGCVDLKAAITFALPSMVSAFLMRIMIVPSMPQYIFGIPKNTFILMFFGGLMMFSGFFMTRPTKINAAPHKSSLWVLILGSIFIGIITGFVGAGGGFLIVPALIFLFSMPVKMAIGTSLVVISINALVGFQGDFMSGIYMDWPFMGMFLSLTFTGMISGFMATRYIQDRNLKTIFGIFVMVLGIFILTKEAFSICTTTICTTKGI